MPFLGDRFRAAREARGLTLADVSEQIHIRAIYLDCIEREDWPAIGAPVYTRGFVRAYARFVGLPAEEAVAEYAVSSGNAAPAPASVVAPAAPPPREPAPPRRPPSPPPPSRPPIERSTPRRPPVPKVDTRGRLGADGRGRGSDGPSVTMIVLAAVACLLVGAVAYTLYDNASRGARPAAVPVATAAPRVARATPAPSRPTAAPLTDTLAFTVHQRSWVQIVLDGQPPLAATLEPGTTKVFHGKTAVLRVGNAGGVSVQVDGKDIGPLGASGDVVEKSFTL